MSQLAGLVLDRRASRPLYQQLFQHIVERIQSGVLTPGTRLPPSRELSTCLGVNRTTVSNAYDQLARMGFVRSRVGQGTFVVPQPVEEHGDEGPAPPPRPELSPMRWSFSRAVLAAADQVRSPGTSSGHPDPIDFAAMVPDEDLFPIEGFREVVGEVLAHKGKELLQYGPAAGYPPLQRYIASRLAERGVRASAEQVLIVNGSQQALDLIFRTLIDPDDPVAVESPTYTIVLPLLAQYHARLVAIPMTAGGMDLDELDKALTRSRPKLIFTMPTFQNPTGLTMSLEARRRLLEIAGRHGVPIVEDDFDSELRFRGESLPTLKALDAEEVARQSVIHIGTFSKALFPGLRLGWLVAPEPVVATIGRTKLFSDYHTSQFLQAAVLEFCRRGYYDRHLARLRAIYGEKMRRLTEAMKQHLPTSMRWTEPEGGFAYWLSLPESASAEALLAESDDLGVLFTPGSHFFARGEGDRFLRLSISKVPLERIEPGIERLGLAIRRHLERRAPAGSVAARDGHEPAFHI